MITKSCSLTFSGIDIIDVDVQVQITPGIPGFIIVGLADKTIAESKERVKAALSAIGLALPAKKILINLSPADLIKEGSHFDLAIATSILANMGVLPAEELNEYLTLGELSLDGKIIPVSGVLPAAVGAVARDKGIICAKENGPEACWSGNERILAADNLLELVNHFKGVQVLTLPQAAVCNETVKYPDLQDIKGQKVAKRVLEIAAAGGHNLLMSGSPGTGKSMLAQRLPGIIPPLTTAEILECTTISSICGYVKNGYLTLARPFRAPHHSCSEAAMVGGGVGRRVRPGEISLAHNGILFLDELPEFNSSVIDSLRQPIETGEILIARSGIHVKYPANFQLVAAMNPCKCGYLYDAARACSKAPNCGTNYLSKISGPILDRFDLHIEVGSEEYMYDLLVKDEEAENSAAVALRVAEARAMQKARYEGFGITLNKQLEGQMLTDYAFPVDAGRDLLNLAAKKFRLSHRAYNRVLKVARTIADMANSRWVEKIHIAEALSYRQPELASTTTGINKSWG